MKQSFSKKKWNKHSFLVLKRMFLESSVLREIKQGDFSP